MNIRATDASVGHLYVTSSSARARRTTGVGVPPTKIKHVLGISKAYTTRVGGGPFPTEMPDLDAQAIRERGKEFGAVTGTPASLRLARPRRLRRKNDQRH